MQNDFWDPKQYNRFRAERHLPFLDLVALIKRQPKMRIADLGCGDGELTHKLHNLLEAEFTQGVELSTHMLEKAIRYQTETLTFLHCNIEDYIFPEKIDLVFANASLQWLPHHLSVLERASSVLNPNGQIAVQLPGNLDWHSHLAAKKVASVFSKKLAKDLTHPMTVHSLDDYSTFLFRLGFQEQVVRMQVYGHELPHSKDVVEWVKGTFLTWYQKQLTLEEFQEFLGAYEKELFTLIPDQERFYYPMKRIFIWGQK